jgi:indole-3-glycerol phosphate synthase
VLAEIIQQKRRELEAVELATGLEALRAQVSGRGPVRSLKAGLTGGGGVSLLAEIKRRSPSKGVLAENLDAGKTARLYESAGASAISVLTEKAFFSGSNDDLAAVRESSTLPVLRKDFMLDEYQVWESRAIGADAILLIAAILEPDELRKLHALAREIALEVLIEVHSEEELREALSVDPEIVGINNRNLETFEVDLGVTERLRPLIPGGIACVSESGIRNRRDVLRMGDLGVDAVLVGEEIVTSPDPGKRIQELLGKA